MSGNTVKGALLKRGSHKSVCGPKEARLKGAAPGVDKDNRKKEVSLFIARASFIFAIS